MKKIGIRFKFCITIGLAIFIFSMVTGLVSASVIRSSMMESKDKLEANIAYVEEKTMATLEDSSLYDEKEHYASGSSNSIGDIIGNSKDNALDRSSESYRVALAIFNETYRKTIFENTFWSFVFGLIGFVIAYPLSGILLKPFRRLTNEIASINEDNIHSQLHIENPKDEIGKIKIAFNKLLVRVSTIIDRQSSFASNVAHELKTPLSVMKIYPETLDEESTIDEYKEVIEVEKKNIDRMAGLVDELLEFSRSIDIKATLVSVAESIDKSIEALKPLIDQKAIEVIKDINDQDIVTNREMFERLVYNILSNATRYNKQGGKIFITYKAHELSIRDTGIGIPEDALEHLFEPLYCVDKSRSRELGGSGLGLAIVKKIADALNYKIEVSSKVDKGTDFTIRV